MVAGEAQEPSPLRSSRHAVVNLKPSAGRCWGRKGKRFLMTSD